MAQDENDLLRAGTLPDDPTDGCVEVQSAGDAGPLLEAEPHPDVVDLLDWRYDRRGVQIAPRSSLRNVVTVLRRDPRWRRRLRYNTFTYRVEVDGRGIRDSDETRAAVWFDETYSIRVSSALISEAVAMVARDQPFHPVRAYLEGLSWDGRERLPTMLQRFWGAPDDPLVSTQGVCWMIGCIARIMSPGCQMDTTLILVGGQGAGKSSSIKNGLCPDPEWFSDARLDFSGRNKDTLQLIAGKWIYEVAELVGTRKRDNEETKAFLTRTVDRYRPPYGRHVQDQERQNVFIGTTNEDAFLRDPTGSRRFWPVLVGKIDIPGLKAARDQLWAEAFARFRRGEVWWLESGDAARVETRNEDFEEQDPWNGPIAAIIRVWPPGKTFTVGDVLDELKVPIDRRSRGHDNRVAEICKRCGCTKAGRARRSGGRVRLWRTPDGSAVALDA